jgi:pyruvate dehydrogenase complex dehydrogenase (E1) component
VVAALNELAKTGEIKASVVTAAIKKLGIDPEKLDPLLA